MKKILVFLLFTVIIFSGCKWNNQSNSESIEHHIIGDIQERNSEKNTIKSMPYDKVDPANNYVTTSFVAENDRYIAYVNPDQPIEGIYLYDKDIKTTVKIYDKSVCNLVLGDNGIYFNDAGRLLKIDFSGRKPQEIISYNSMLTAYRHKIYYASLKEDLYELNMADDSVKRIAQAEKVFTEPDMSMQFQNLCMGDRLYFTSSINRNGERIAVLMGLNADGSVDRIHECISLVDMAVYDRGFLYFADRNGLARIKADGSGLEERLVSGSTDGQFCDHFYVYDGKWYYQKYTKDGSSWFCMGSSTDGERLLLNLNDAGFGSICEINQTADYILITMTDPDIKGNNYNYIVWVLDRNHDHVWRLGKTFE